MRSYIVIDCIHVYVIFFVLSYFPLEYFYVVLIRFIFCNISFSSSLFLANVTLFTLQIFYLPNPDNWSGVGSILRPISVILFEEVVKTLVLGINNLSTNFEDRVLDNKFCGYHNKSFVGSAFIWTLHDYFLAFRKTCPY